jgi:hypothetical protein
MVVQAGPNAVEGVLATAPDLLSWAGLMADRWRSAGQWLESRMPELVPIDRHVAALAEGALFLGGWGAGIYNAIVLLSLDPMDLPGMS